MCPGVAVLGGGGAGGDGSGDGSGGDGGGDGNGNGDGSGGNGDGKGAGGCGQGGGDGSGCPNHHGTAASGSISAGDPVDVVTGRMFTHPVSDVTFGGPFPLSIVRSYSTAARNRNVGLGYGWSHSLAWEIEDRRSSVVLLCNDGLEITFGKIEDLAGVVGPNGLILGRTENGFILRRTDYVSLIFGASISTPMGKRSRLLALEDATGNRLNLRYRDNHLVQVVDCVGRVVDVTRNRQGDIEGLKVVDPINADHKITLVAFHYDDQGDLVATTDADGATQTFTYDDNHLMKSRTAPSGLTFFYRHDRHGRCVETWGEYPGKEDVSLASGVPKLLADRETLAKGIHHIKLFFHDNNYSEVVDSSTVHRYFGNPLGKCEKAVSSGGVFSRAYDANGHLLAFTDGLDATTTYERDYLGRELRVTDPLGRTTTIHRYSDGTIREVIDAAGGVTTVTRTSNSITWTDPIGATFTAIYGDRGLVKEALAPDGTCRKFSYDSQGNLVSIIGPGEQAQSATYDGWGRCTSIRDADDLVTTFEYSPTGRVLAVARASTLTRYQYDGDGNVIAITDAGGNVTHMSYGGFRKLCETRRADGKIVKLKYDREGRLAEVHNANGGVHAMTYDAFGNRTYERTFDGRELRYKYDAMARLISSIDGKGNRTEYQRDAAGQLIKCTYADDSVVEFEYDALGEIVAATSSIGRFRFERNALGWIIRETQEIAGESFSVSTTYDAMGNVALRSTTLGHTAAFTRDAHGSRASVLLNDTEEIRLTNDICGRETARLLAKGGRIETVYDSFGAVIRRLTYSDTARHGIIGGTPHHHTGASAPRISADRAYRYTSTRELEAIWDRTLGITHFQYDVLGQLTSVAHDGAPNFLYWYDPNGNIIDGTDPYEREYGPGDRLLRQKDRRLVWNDAGQLIEEHVRGARHTEITRYQWWATGLLRSVDLSDGTRVQFAYDPWARRVSKQVTITKPDKSRQILSSTRFVWDGTQLAHEITQSIEADGTANIRERTYLFEDIRTVPVAHHDTHIINGIRTTGEWFHYVNDDTGAPELIVDNAGNIACSIRRSPWGNAEFAPGATTTTSLRFRGQYFDDETGLSYNRYRYYSTSAGRYISTDPIEILGGMNLFAYATNCPTSAIDVEGLISMLAIIKDGNGNPVATGTNADPRAATKPFNTGKPCAEVAALNSLAGQMGAGTTTADVRKKFTQEGYTMETYSVPGDTSKAQKDAMAGRLPKGAAGVCPCGRCGAMIKGNPQNGEPSIQSQVLANNNPVPGRGKMRPWNGSTLFGS
ncbi:MAG: RHS repeat-associated core domain-containing protein [Byssovorax sp.]